LDYEIRQMSLGEMLDTGFRLLQNHFVILVSITAILYVPYSMLAGYLQSTGDPADPLRGLPALIPLILLGPLAQIAITVAISELYLGHETTFGSAYREAGSMFMPYLGTSLLVGLGMMLGMMLLIIPGIYLAVNWMLVGPVVVAERVYGFAAMKRSAGLIRGYWWSSFGIIFVSFLLTSVVSSGLGLLFTMIPFVGSVLSGVVQAVTFAFTSSVLVVLYFDRRCRHEDFDLHHLASKLVGDSDSAMSGAVTGAAGTESASAP